MSRETRLMIWRMSRENDVPRNSKWRLSSRKFLTNHGAARIPERWRQVTCNQFIYSLGSSQQPDGNSPPNYSQAVFSFWHAEKNHIVTRKRQLARHTCHCRCNFSPARLECVPLAQPPQQNHAATYGADTADNQNRRLARGSVPPGTVNQQVCYLRGIT